jgi:hypothetical protein
VTSVIHSPFFVVDLLDGIYDSKDTYNSELEYGPILGSSSTSLLTDGSETRLFWRPEVCRIEFY